MKIGVRIMPRNEVLDSQGRAVERTLKQHGKEISQVRVGKFIELDIATSDKEVALKQAKDLAEFVLYNPLIENYELEVL